MPIITATITTPSTRSPPISLAVPLLLSEVLVSVTAAAAATTESPSYCPNPIRPLPAAGSWSGTAAHVCVWTPFVQPIVAPAASVCGLHLVVIHVFASRGSAFVVVAAAAAFVMVAGLAAPAAAVVVVAVVRVVGLVEDSKVGRDEVEVEVSKGLTTAVVVVGDVVEEERAVVVEIPVSAEVVVVVATGFVVVVVSCAAAAALGSEELVAVVVVGTWRSSRSAIVTGVPGGEIAAASAPEMRMAEVVKVRIMLDIKIRLILCIS